MSALSEIRDIAHGLFGAAGLFGFSRIGEAAADLEQATTAELSGDDNRQEVERTLDRLLACVGLVLPDFGHDLALPILDRALHESLRESFGADRLRALLAKFEAQVEAGALVDPDLASDRLALLQQSHRMIGTAGALGFHAFSDVSRELEEACWRLEEQFSALTDMLKRANEIKLSTKLELNAALTKLGRAA